MRAKGGQQTYTRALHDQLAHLQHRVTLHHRMKISHRIGHGSAKCGIQLATSAVGGKRQ